MFDEADRTDEVVINSDEIRESAAVALLMYIYLCLRVIESPSLASIGFKSDCGGALWSRSHTKGLYNYTGWAGFLLGTAYIQSLAEILCAGVCVSRRRVRPRTRISRRMVASPNGLSCGTCMTDDVRWLGMDVRHNLRSALLLSALEKKRGS